MPYLGAHESIAGGLYRAFDRIEKVGGESLQIFTRNQRQWNPPPLSGDEVSLFKKKWAQHDAMPTASHASYLINLGSGKQELARKSILALADEMKRCDELGIPWLVLHPGSHGGAGVAAGLKNVSRNLDAAFALAGGKLAVMVLLETTAGQGTGLGSRFEELAWVLDSSANRERLGICVDTCHIFAAGYDIRSPAAYQRTFAEFDRLIGLDRIHFFHLNDSKKEYGSHVDRHEHIGRGEIGLAGFRCLLNDPRFAEQPMTLETPKGKELREDMENLAVLRSLLTDSGTHHDG
ncbi:MAG: deoxyribonuclease IV [Proteobacteria bacterium]|nr:deoxyribonuclease IV [Pseudomonadota bacterium]